ncbi:MAG: restriction endonuclease subunit S [Lentisphaerota bacterium]
MRETWKSTILGEVADFSNGRTSPERFDSGEYEVFGANGIIGYSDKMNSEEDTIIIGRVGSYCGSLHFSKNSCWVTDNAIKANSKKITDPFYLYYFLITQKLNSKAAGSGQPLINQEILNSIGINLPLLPEQKAIAAVLSSLDDKIELLRKQNKTLENVAQTIFKEWFVNFKVKGEKLKVNPGTGLPEGWKIGKMGDVVEIRGGTTPSTSNPNFWDGEINWTSPKDLSISNEVFLLKTEKKITVEGLKQISSGLLPKGTLLLSSRAPVGYLAISGINISINQGYIAFLPGSYFSNYFMYLWLTINMQEVINAANGSTFLEISKSSFRNIRCIIPSKDSLDSFELVIKPFFDKIENNIIQIRTLSRLRDTLLPKLMKGEIRVKYKEASS